jgi:hypothetical protein
MGLWSWLKSLGKKEAKATRSIFPFRPLKYGPPNWHYDDCPLQGTWNEGCWCEHRGPFSHYGGGLKPGWHREQCPRVGIAWIVTWKPNEWWKLPPCECRDKKEWGQFILTLQDGTIHGPAPGPKPAGWFEEKYDV